MLEWFLNGNLACSKAFTSSDTAGRKNSSVCLFDINIPFLQAALEERFFFFFLLLCLESISLLL